MALNNDKIEKEAMLSSSTSKIRILLAALLIVVALGTYIAWNTPSIVDNDLAGYLFGYCVGPSLAVFHIPGSNPRESSVLWKRASFSIIIFASTLYVALYPFHCYPVDCPAEGIYRNHVILWSCLFTSPIAIACVVAKHPRSSYAYDAKWCVFVLWAVVLAYAVYFILKSFKVDGWMQFVLTAALTSEGVVLSWIICLFCGRIKSLGLLAPAHSTIHIYIMSIALQANIWIIVLGKILGSPPGLKIFAMVLRAGFILIWLAYIGLLVSSLFSSLGALGREARRVRGRALAETFWARRVVSMELAACLSIGLTTSLYWGLVEVIDYLKLTEDTELKAIRERVINPFTSWVHRVDLTVNALSIAIFSGILLQIQAPVVESDVTGDDMSRMCTTLSIGDGLQTPCRSVFSQKVEDLAGRGIRLRMLLQFVGSLLKKEVMPSFDPWTSSTNDVVRQAIIPLSRAKTASGGGSALATIWNQGCPLYPERMVTHNWTNSFLHLVAAVVAEGLGTDTFSEHADALSTPEGLAGIVDLLERKRALDLTFWICAFSINQHASICGGFGPAPPESAPEPERCEWERKTRDTVTNERYDLCGCAEPKYFNDQLAHCELNKFDEVMKLLHERCEGFAEIIVVDWAFQVFFRAWCVAEIVQGHILDIPAHVKIHSVAALDAHYETLSILDVRDCQATRSSDKEMILAKIIDINAFNLRLQQLIFGTAGLFSKWVDGAERAGQVGRIVRRAQIPTTNLEYTPHCQACSCCGFGRKRISSTGSDGSDDSDEFSSASSDSV